ncbi:MAG: serine hydrolase domain-containing protein [Thermomicrobiales bacterium]
MDRESIGGTMGARNPLRKIALGTQQVLTRRAALAAGVGLGAALAAAHGAQRSAAQEGTPMTGNTTAFTPAEQVALLEIVNTLAGEQRVPGVAAGVWTADRGEWVYTVGIGDLRTAAPIRRGDHFRIASVTKTFVATVVLQLVDEGKLALDDRLESFVSGIANGNEITIRQLLNMSAGIYNFIHDADFDKTYTNDPLADYDAADEIAIIRRYPADFPPGTEGRYSDSNYVLLGAIIEQVTGQSTAAEIQRRILDPLGMTQTRYPDTPEIPEPFPHGYAADPGSPNLRDLTRSNPLVAGAAGAMISTLDDLHLWARALADGTLLSPETQRQRLETVPFQTVPGFDLRYGLGIMDLNGFYGHTGAIFGYSTWVLRSPERDATLVVLANRGETETEFAGKIAVDILHFLYPDAFPRAASAPATPAADS